MSGEPRIPVLPEEEWTSDVEAIFPVLVPPGSTVKGSDFNSLLVLARHPEIANPWVRFNVAVSRGTVLPATLRELAILRIAWRDACQYEWVHHVIAGSMVGLTVAHFDGVRQDTPPAGFTPQEAAVIRATDELCRTANLSDDAWRALEAFLDHKQILELLFVVGCFRAVSTMLNATRTEVEPAYVEIVRANGWPLLAGATADA